MDTSKAQIIMRATAPSNTRD